MSTQDERPDASAFRTGRRRWRASLVLAVAAGVLVAACGGGNGGGGSGAGTGSTSPTATASPKVGGTLTFGELNPVSGFDPITLAGSGTTGLTELTAVFDTLMRYNYDTHTYDPGTALSATPNADDTVWTIKLRPGVTFTDGTPYDAAAVAFGLSRFRAGSPGAPSCEQLVACPRPSTFSLGPYLKDATAVDATTVRVTLTLPWASFPVILATEAGLIPSPTALKKCDASAPANQCAFNTAPVGAGPFMVTSFKPGESVTMVRNPHYWGGQVYLDGLNFISANDGGGARTLAMLQAGTVQAAFLRDPSAVASAHDANIPGISNRQYIGSTVLVFNVGSPTSGVHDLRVRQAIAMAIDPKVVAQRASDGKGDPTSQLLPPSFPWYPNVPGPTYDPAAAKKLVAEAKADGWNGTVRLLANTNPTYSNAGLAIQAMLESVGMKVQLDNSKSVAAAIGLYVKGDFDIWMGAFNVSGDDWGTVALATPLLSTSAGNRTGLKDPALDAGLNALFAAKTDAQKTAAWKTIETQINAQLPLLSLGTTEELVALSHTVHGAMKGMNTSVRFDKAWLG